MTARHAFTFRLDDDLVGPLAARVAAEERSRNWVINDAIRGHLNGRAADDTQQRTRDRPRAAGSASARGAQPPRPDPEPGPPPPALGAGRHFHRFTERVPGTERHVQGQPFATFRCACDKTMEKADR